MKKIIYIAVLMICAAGQISSVQASYGIKRITFIPLNASTKQLLFIAVSNEDRRDVKKYIKQISDAGDDLNTLEDSYRVPALHAAVKYGLEEIMLLLLDAGADVNSKDISSRTPLHAAVHEKGGARWVEFLLDKGAKVDSADHESMTPLHYAAQVGHEQIVRVLLNAGADTTLKDSEDRTPLDIITGKIDGFEPPSRGDFRSRAQKRRELLLKYKKVKQLLQSAAQVAAIDEWRPLKHRRYPRRMRTALAALVVVAKARKVVKQ